MGSLDACNGLLPIMKILRKGILPKVFIIVPIALMLYAMVDFGKAVTASDEKEVKAAQSRLIKRIIYAALIFLVPWLITLVMDVIANGVSDGSTTGWQACWLAAKE